jgi:hypothetical protein
MIARTRAPRRILIALLALGASAAARASAADLRQKFLAEYPAAVARLEEAYSHIRMDGRWSYSLNNVAADTGSGSTEYLREGQIYRMTMTTPPSKENGLQEPFLFVMIGNWNKNRVMTKRNGKWNGPFDRNGDSRNSTGQHPRDRMMQQPIYVPTCADAVRVLDYVQKLGTSVTAAMATKLGGVEVVEVDASDQATAGPNFYKFFFLPASWALAGWDGDLAVAPAKVALPAGNAPATPVPTRIQTHGRATYDAGAHPPRLKTVEHWTETPAPGNAKAERFRYDVESIEFGPIPKEEFSPAVYGLIDQFYDPARAQRMWWGLLIDGPLCVVLGVWAVRRYAAWKRERE